MIILGIALFVAYSWLIFRIGYMTAEKHVTEYILDAFEKSVDHILKEKKSEGQI